MYLKPDMYSFSVPLRREFHHWDAKSEKFATVSQLFSAFLQGWEVNSLVICQSHTLPRGRKTQIYHFELRLAGEYKHMPVLDNPALQKLILQEGLRIVSYRQVSALDVVGYGKVAQA